MDIKPQKSDTAKPKPLAFRDNPEVKKKIDAHKQANPDDAAYYTRLVKEYPERAVDTLILRDVQKHENEMRLIQKQLPQAEAFYRSQSPEAKARIDSAMEGVTPYYKDKAFVNAVLRESDRQTRKQFATTAPAPSAEVAKSTTAEPPKLNPGKSSKVAA